MRAGSHWHVQLRLLHMEHPSNKQLNAHSSVREEWLTLGFLLGAFVVDPALVRSASKPDGRVSTVAGPGGSVNARRSLKSDCPATILS